MQFEQCLEVQGEENVNLKVGLSGLNTTGEIGLLFIHGMGSSGATWHNQITQLSPYFLTMCPDLRGHGSSGDCNSLDIKLLVNDIIKIVDALSTSILGGRKLMLIGHSVGASIATFAAHQLASTRKSLLAGVVCLDMAEGTALAALPHMKATLDSWPKSFLSVASCVDWSVRHHHPTSTRSAVTSVPPLLRLASPDGPFVFRTCLSNFEDDWESWFTNYNSAFLKLLKINVPHFLLLSTPERLDNELTIAQMQGKFQLKLIQGGCGEHFLHEDQPDQTMAILTTFFHSCGYISQEALRDIMARAMFSPCVSNDFAPKRQFL